MMRLGGGGGVTQTTLDTGADPGFFSRGGGVSWQNVSEKYLGSVGEATEGGFRI